MDWLVIIGDSCLDTLLWMAGLTVAFGLLALLMPCNRGMFWWKDLRGFGNITLVPDNFFVDVSAFTGLSPSTTGRTKPSSKRSRTS